MLSDLECQVIFLEVLARYPTQQEILDNNSRLTQDDLRNYLKTTTEYLKLIGLHSGDTTFSNYTLYGSNFSSTNFSGLSLANGKIALITSDEPHKMAHSLISTNFDVNDLGTYSHNTTETFDYTSLNFFNRDSSSVIISDLKQSLNMLTANFTTTYSITSSNINVNSNVKIDVTSDIRVLRQYPFCTMQTITLNAYSNINLDIYHNLNTPEEIQNVRYNNNLINASISGSNTSIYLFQANGLLKEQEKSISTCCGYSFDTISNVSYKGYNISQTNTNNAFTKFTLELTPNIENRFHILSSTMTQLDFGKPDIETQRTLINALSHTPDEIIAEHVSEWSKLWNSKIYITPKDGITTDEADKINTFNKFIKLSLYNIYSSVRNDFNVDINPLNISSIDLSGHIFWNGELWLLPVLTFLMPKAARSLLDYRYHQLENSIKLAAAHGYKGSKYAYQNDILGYNNVYWNTISPLQIFNTALISIAVWNYYRVTRDYDWLYKKGFEILKNNADFFVSKLELDEVTGTYNINNVYSIDGNSGNNNSFTNYLAKLALQYALQAKYELDYVYAVDWETYIDLIQINIIADPGEGLYNIINTNDDNLPTMLDLLEPLLILYPYYSKYFFTITNNTNGRFEYDAVTLKDNLTSYLSRLNPEYEQNSFNKLLIATLYAKIAQLEKLDTITNIDYRKVAIDEFNTHILEFFENATLQPWKTFYNSQYTKTYNDLGVSSMFILGLLTTIVGLRITGNIDSSKIYLEDLGIKSEPSNIMPNTWRSLEVYGIGSSSSLHYCVLNQLLYP